MQHTKKDNNHETTNADDSTIDTKLIVKNKVKVLKDCNVKLEKKTETLA